MANTASARKRIRQTAKRTLRNQANRTRVRNAIKSVETAISSGDKAAAQAAIKAAQPQMQRAIGKGVVHKNTMARKLSRMTHRIKGLAA
jgi:small subunit ribosomal protein S20